MKRVQILVKTACFILFCLILLPGVSVAETLPDHGPDHDPDQSPKAISQNTFHRSICFNCHRQNSVSAEDRTRDQWELLIHRNGHRIFKKIPWENEQQKQQITNYLLENAKGFRSEGIGVWR